MLADLSLLILELYRIAEQASPEGFQALALAAIQARMPFDAAKWITGYVDGGKLVPYATYRSGFQPGGAVHELDYLSTDPLTSLTTSITLWRSFRHGEFTPRDRRFLDAVGAHLGENHGWAEIQNLLRATRTGAVELASSGVADRHAFLQVAPPEFQRLLRLEWPQWRERELPAPLGRQIRAQGAGRYVGERIVITVSGMSDVFLLQARERRPADSLSARELEIALLLARGNTYKEAARRAGISPSTVRAHLRSVFAKLDVRKQSEMAAALRDIR